MKLLYLALKNVVKKWDAVQNWNSVLNRFEILWADRIKAALGTSGKG